MRTIFFILPGLAVMALAFWAYSENYATQRAMSHARDLHREIGAQHETLAVLRAEWAYLNRPARLRELAAMNFDRLQLLPMQPHHFARVEQLPYPRVESGLGPLDGVITLQAEPAQ